MSIPGLAGFGLDVTGIPDLVAAAQCASSMRVNPITLSDAEVTEIVTRSLLGSAALIGRADPVRSVIVVISSVSSARTHPTRLADEER